MAGQPIKKRADRKWRQGRNILGLFLAIALPLGLVMLLLTADLKQNLSDWNTIPGATRNGAIVLGWKPPAVPESTPSLQHSRVDGTRIAMLGFMMDGTHPVPDRAPISSFTLMPEAGFWLHPVHRNPDEMVDVSLAPGVTVPFTGRRLVWVTGRFRHLRTTVRYGHPLYAIDTASGEDASEKELVRWFRP